MIAIVYRDFGPQTFRGSMLIGVEFWTGEIGIPGEVVFGS